MCVKCSAVSISLVQFRLGICVVRVDMLCANVALRSATHGKCVPQK